MSQYLYIRCYWTAWDNKLCRSPAVTSGIIQYSQHNLASSLNHWWNHLVCVQKRKTSAKSNHNKNSRMTLSKINSKVARNRNIHLTILCHEPKKYTYASKMGHFCTFQTHKLQRHFISNHYLSVVDWKTFCLGTFTHSITENITDTFLKLNSRVYIVCHYVQPHIKCISCKHVYVFAHF